MGDRLDEAIRVCAPQSLCQVRSEPTWVARMDTQTRSLVAASAPQERGRWALKCQARRHEPKHRWLPRHIGPDGNGETGDPRGFT